MTSAPSRLNDLLNLAKEPSSEKRRELLRGITDVFLESTTEFNTSQAESFGAIVGQIAREFEMSVRQELAERLACVPEAPRNLISMLANDEIDVAQTILQSSGVLHDADLIAIVRLQSQEHLAAICERDTISETVTNELVERGDDKVFLKLVANEGAELSRSSMETIVQRSEKNKALQAPIIQRQDLPPDLMNEMFFFVSSKLRSFILDRNKDLDPKLVDEMIQSTTDSLSLDLESSEKKLTRAQEYVAQAEQRNQLNEGFLVQMVREKKIREFICAFSLLTGLDERSANRVLSDPTGEAVAIACKSSSFDRSTFSTIILLMDKGQLRNLNNTNVLLRIYDKIDTETAQRVMRFWRVRKMTLNEKESLAA